MTLRLTRLGDTSFYQPPETAKAQPFLFFLWAGDDPPPELAADDTWANQGTPLRVGYWLFVDDREAAPSLPVTELLPTPAVTGFAWMSTTKPATVYALVVPQLDADQRPIVATDVTVALPPGQPSLGFGAGAPLSGFGSGGLDTFGIGYPPQPGGPIPGGPAVLVPLTGPTAGAFRMTGLTGGGSSSEAIKNVVSIAVDPTDPFNPARNFVNFAGTAYRLLIGDRTARLEQVR